MCDVPRKETKTDDGKEAAVDPAEAFLADNRGRAVDEPAVLWVWTLGIVNELRPAHVIMGQKKLGERTALDRLGRRHGQDCLGHPSAQAGCTRPPCSIFARGLCKEGRRTHRGDSGAA